jgi:hypothetical protein
MSTGLKSDCRGFYANSLIEAQSVAFVCLQQERNQPIVFRRRDGLPVAIAHVEKRFICPDRIDLTVPGAEIVVNHEPTLHNSLRRMESEEHAKGQELSAPHKDVYVAIRDAFKVARRKLQAYSHRRNGAVKHHETHA